MYPSLNASSLVQQTCDNYYPVDVILVALPSSGLTLCKEASLRIISLAAVSVHNSADRKVTTFDVCANTIRPESHYGGCSYTKANCKVTTVAVCTFMEAENALR